MPCGPINTIDQIFANPQVQHLGIAKQVSHQSLALRRWVGQPIHMSGYPQPHVLRELGHDEAAIAGLRRRGVV